MKPCVTMGLSTAGKKNRNISILNRYFWPPIEPEENLILLRWQNVFVVHKTRTSVHFELIWM